MRLKDNTNPFIHVNPPYQLMVIHSSKLVYTYIFSASASPSYAYSHGQFLFSAGLLRSHY